MAGVKGGAALRKALFTIGKALGAAPTVRVGYLANATYPDGTPVAMVAALQEFGAPKAGIPPRPTFRPMVAKNKADWPKEVGVVLVAKDYDGTATMAQMGQRIVGELRQEVADLKSPQLSPVTLMLRSMRAKNPGLVVTGKTVAIARARVARGDKPGQVSTKPLVDRGIMFQSSSFEVVKAGSFAGRIKGLMGGGKP